MDNNASSLKPDESVMLPKPDKTVSSEEAAKILGIKPDDVKSLVDKELLKEVAPGMFNAGDLTGMAASRGLSLAQEAAQVGVNLQRAIATSLNVVQSLATVAFAAAVGYGLTVAGFVVAYSYYPARVADWVTQKNPSALQAIFQQPGTVALGILKYAQPSAYKTVAQNTIIDANDVLTVGKNGSITPTGALIIPKSSYLQIVSTGLIKNLNADFLRGLTPGTTTGNLAIIGQVSGLSDNSIETADIQDGAVTNAELATITDSNKISGSAVQINGSGGLTNNSGLSLLTSCGDTEILKWNDTSSVWECSTDAGAGGGIGTLQEGDLTVVAAADTLDFLAADFTISESPTNEGNVAIDYTNSKITRSNQTESILGAWTFSTLSSTGNLATLKGSDFGTVGTQNDVDMGTGSLFRYTGATDATFTGLSGGTDGRIIEILNSGSASLILTNEGGGSAAGNRILTPTGSSLTVSSNSSVSLRYDSGSSRWRITSSPVTNATLASTFFIQGGNGFGSTAVLGTTDANLLNFITSGSARFSVAAGAPTLTGQGSTSLTSTGTLDLSSAAGSALTINSGTTGAINLGTDTDTESISISSGGE